MEYGFAPGILPESGIRRMFSLAQQMTDVCNLSVGQPDAPTPAHVIEAYVAALQAGCTRYTGDQGHPDLLAALAEWYSGVYGFPIDAGNVLVTAGGCEAVYIALRTALSPGDEAIVIEPSFVLFRPTVELCGARPVIVATTAETGYLPDLDQLAAAVTPRTKLLILNSPSNPTGATFPTELLAGVVRLCQERGIWLLADEVYERLILEGDYCHVARLAGGMDGLLCIGSFSKTYSMAGMRVGYLLASAATIQQARKVHMYTSNVANTAGQIAAVAALRGDQAPVDAMVTEYRRRRDRLVELVDGCPVLTGYRPRGAFYLSPGLPAGVDSEEFCFSLLRECGVCVVPGTTFGSSCRNTFRIAYSASLETIEEAFRRLQPWLDRQSF